MKIAVVIPCYRVSAQILDVLSRIGPEVDHIVVVDDHCPEQSGAKVEATCKDSRVKVLYHTSNQGVGGATVTGYRAALELGADVMVKLDGDGQMSPDQILMIAGPVLAGIADYSKGNRFYGPQHVKGMPLIRLWGNSVLSFTAKICCGYWNIMDPTNGFTAIHRTAAQAVGLNLLEKRYFFETDMLYRLNLCRAVVKDVPMFAHYGSEKSNLRIQHAAIEFPYKSLIRLLHRVAYQYLVRDFSLGSIMLILGFLLLLGGSGFGAYHWMAGISRGIPATAGTVMLAAVPALLGSQFLLQFLYQDVMAVPNQSIQAYQRLLDEAIHRQQLRSNGVEELPCREPCLLKETPEPIPTEV